MTLRLWAHVPPQKPMQARSDGSQADSCATGADKFGFLDIQIPLEALFLQQMRSFYSCICFDPVTASVALQVHAHELGRQRIALQSDDLFWSVGSNRHVCENHRADVFLYFAGREEDVVGPRRVHHHVVIEWIDQENPAAVEQSRVDFLFKNLFICLMRRRYRTSDLHHEVELCLPLGSTKYQFEAVSRVRLVNCHDERGSAQI